MPTPKSKSGYKTKRKYGCPYCDVKLPRGDLVSHVQEEHEMMIPEGYTAARVVYEKINGKNYGTCMVCGCKVYEWNEKIWRYRNLCGKKSCMEAVKKKAAGNHLDDPDKQKKMLANRSISGEYEFSDEGRRSYVASYERKTLQFMDKVCNIPSKDVMTPGPTITYEYNGETHTWITDIYYIPANLVIDCKDGGKNPNNRPMDSYREKQLAKEKAIAKQGQYNYLRLTDNDFGQFLSALADIRYGEQVKDTNKGIYINEGGPSGNVMISSRTPGTDRYIIPYMLRTTFDGRMHDERDTGEIDGLLFGWDESSKCFVIDENCQIVIMEVEEAMKGKRPVAGKQRFNKVKFHKDETAMAKLNEKKKKDMVKEAYDSRKQKELAMASLFLHRPITSYKDILMLEEEEHWKNVMYEGVVQDLHFNGFYHATMNESTVVQPTGKHLFIMKDDNGYYVASNNPEYQIASKTFSSIEDIPQSTIDLMDDMYENRRPRNGGYPA